MNNWDFDSEIIYSAWIKLDKILVDALTKRFSEDVWDYLSGNWTF